MRNILVANPSANSGYKKTSFSSSFRLFGVGKFMKKTRRSLRLVQRNSARVAFGTSKIGMFNKLK